MTQPKYWFTFHKYAGPRKSHGCHVFQILVTFLPSSASQLEWSKIRLVIVKDDSKRQDSDMSGEEDFEHKDSPNIQISLRNTYLDIRRKQFCSTPTITEGDTLTLALSLSKIGGNWKYAHLQPYLFCNDTLKRHSQILYDRGHPLNTTGTILLTFEGTTKVVADRNDLPTPRATMYLGYPGATVHSFHFQPTMHRIRFKAIALPANILIRIANEVIQCHTYGYRREIFRLGTISRAWTPVLDLFFRLHAKFDRCLSTEDRLEDEACIISVARCLQLRPERALLMTGFSLTFYSQRERWRQLSKEEKFEALKAANAILATATSIVQLDLHPIPSTLCEGYLSALSKLNRVLICGDLTMVLTMSKDDPAAIRPVGVEDVLQLLQKWPRLVSLTITFGDEHPGICSNDNVDDRPLTCSISHLTIRSIGGQMTGTQFRRFWESKVPRLTQVILSNISGPSNKDLHLGLYHNRETLRFLQITGSTFPKAEDEVYAIDSLIADLTSLQNLNLYNSDCISTKCIARKRRNADLQREDALIVRGALSIVTDGIVEALKSSGWSYISLGCKEPVDPATPAQQQAKAIAAEKCIDFSWQRSYY